jgi:hypothetical protein
MWLKVLRETWYHCFKHALRATDMRNQQGVSCEREDTKRPCLACLCLSYFCPRVRRCLPVPTAAVLWTRQLVPPRHLSRESPKPPTTPHLAATPGLARHGGEPGAARERGGAHGQGAGHGQRVLEVRRGVHLEAIARDDSRSALSDQLDNECWRRVRCCVPGTPRACARCAGSGCTRVPSAVRSPRPLDPRAATRVTCSN